MPPMRMLFSIIRRPFTPRCAVHSFFSLPWPPVSGPFNILGRAPIRPGAHFQTGCRIARFTCVLVLETSQSKRFARPHRPFGWRAAGGNTLNAAQWLQKTRARVVVNAGYFDGQGQPMGLRAGKNTVGSKMRRADWGVFWVKNGVAHLSHTRDFSPTFLPDEAIQCGPRLVVNSVVTKLKPQWARRTGVGIDSQGRVVIAVSNDELSLDEWARLWASPSGLGCTDALNMDGGPSTQLAVSGRSDLDISGGWRLSEAMHPEPTHAE